MAINKIDQLGRLYIANPQAPLPKAPPDAFHVYRHLIYRLVVYICTDHVDEIICPWVSKGN